MHGNCAAGVPVSIAKVCRESDNSRAMAASDTAIIILAAGKGTRMRSELAKVLHRAGGRPLIEHVVRACQGIKPAQLLAVVGHQSAEVSAVATARPSANAGPIVPKPVVMPAMTIDATAIVVMLSI